MNIPVWTEFLEKFAQEKNDLLFSFLKQGQPVSLIENTLTLSYTNQGLASYLEKRKSDIERFIEKHTGSKIQIEFIFETKQTKKEAPPILTYEPSKEDVFIRAGLALKYQFDNFAVSSSNQVAFAAAQAVAASPGTSYNPLFLYGGVGVGKTHLAQSIARFILERDVEKKALFAPGDRFINEHIESIREKTTARFRRKYRYLDIVIVDDVQFIAGKDSVQDEFFHMFNSIVTAGGQVVLTSDRPPHEIKNLTDRLRSRFSGGLIVDVQPPDFELRSAILLIKAKEKNIEIDIEAAKVIADQIEDTRGLEGALISIYAQTLNTGSPKVTLDAVDRYFSQRQVRITRKVSPNDIIRIVCTFYNVKQSQIKSPVRSESIAMARQIVMYLIRHELNMNYEDIAHLLNRKDHTTVMHGYDKVQNMIMKDQNFKEEIDNITQSLHQST